MKLRIMLADDHQMFREALRAMLEREPDLEVVAEAGSGLDIIKMAREHAPDIVCMDIGLPGMNGIEATRQLLAVLPSVKVIGLSAYPDQRYVVDMMNAGAAGYVTKAEAGGELLRAIAAVRRDRIYLCPDVARAVTDALAAKSGESAIFAASRLGARERQVLQLVAEGWTSAEVAERLHIAQATVEVHRRNIMRKLDLHSVADLTRYAIRNGLVAG